MRTSQYALAVCQPGMERALKTEMERLRPDLHPGFQRPGLVTFTATAKPFGVEDAPQAIFARMWAASAGPCTTLDAVLATARDVGATHCFCGPRDAGEGAAPAVGEAIAIEASKWQARLEKHFTRGTPARGDIVLDVLTAPEEPPIVGWHAHGPGRHEAAGGMFDYPVPDKAPLRAWRKVVEGLRWSRAPVAKGELVLELGAAPGGGTRAFAEAGLRVIAVDPQPMDPEVAAMPGVTVFARRIGDLKLASLPADVRWLAADPAIPPEDVLGAIARLRPALPNLRGYLLILKLNDEGVIRHLPQTFARLRDLGATSVIARQLPANRKDIFVYAAIGATRTVPKRTALPRTAPRPATDRRPKVKPASSGGSRR